MDADLRNVRRFINSSPRASERFELRPAKHRVEPFTVNNHGVILVQVCGSGYVVILIALIALQRSKIDAIEDTLHNALRQVRINASREHDVNIRTALGGEIVQAKILFAARLLVDGRASAGLVRFAFQSSRKDWLRVTARIEGCWLIHFLIDPELLGPEGPPQCNKNRKTNGNQYPFAP